MANSHHLEILKGGLTFWNQWRETSGNQTIPDLRKANLEGMDLREVNFCKAMLDEANLRQADLSRANLRWATITKADIREAKLDVADLCYANAVESDLRNAQLVGADLRADFSNADLSHADLLDADLTGADLRKARLLKACFHRADLRGAKLNQANLSHANLMMANLFMADLGNADLTSANLHGAKLQEANFSYAMLREAELSDTILYETNFHGADLSGANLRGAQMVKTCLENANLSSCSIYGISAWNLNLKGANQTNLIITDRDEPKITVDNIEVAQFIYLLLYNPKIRDMIDTMTSKVVLILGRFTPERKAVLDSIREELRRCNYVPILFDFERPANRSFTETVSTLAHMARFVLIDITDAKSTPQELQRIVPDLPSVPVQPLLEASSKEYGMFEDFKSYPWVLETVKYNDAKDLIMSLKEKVIVQAEARAESLRTKR